MTAASSPVDWVYVMAPFWLYGIIVLALLAFGSNGDETNPVRIFFKRISTSLEAATGLPAWSMAGALTGLTFLAVAAMGLYWDVAWHIDHGRDEELFTPSHVMILLGLGGLVWSAATAVVFASIDRAPARLRLGPVRLPWSALALAGLGAGGVAAFPLDNLWHEAYGVDVTLWSPTHLQLVAGGGLGPVAVWLMIREGAKEWAGQRSPTLLGRVIEVTTFGAILTGLSTFQGEFDFGVPQFQALYLPVLIAVAGGVGLTVARVVLGAGGALLAVVGFVVLRGVLALLVGGSLNHTVPRFPLYLAGALAVEAVALLVGTQRRLRFALVAGAAVGTVGLAGELAWIELSGWADLPPALLPKALFFSALAAVSGAVIGTALSHAAGGDVGSPGHSAATGAGAPGDGAGAAGVAGNGVGRAGVPATGAVAAGASGAGVGMHAAGAVTAGASGAGLGMAAGAAGASGAGVGMHAGAAGASGAGVGMHAAAAGAAGASRIPTVALVLAGLGVVVALAYPLPRNVGAVDAVIRLDRAGDEATVAVALDPPGAAEHATLFGIVSWQGGGRVSAALREVGPGRYVSSRPVPVTGSWKTMVGLQRGDEVMAAPIYLPADPEIGAGEVPALPERRVAFSRNTDILLREVNDGPAWPAVAAYLGVAVVAGMWLFLLALAVVRIGRPPTPAPALLRADARRPAVSQVA